MVGFSGKPLPKKLGLEGSLTLVTIDAPVEYLSWLGHLPKYIAPVTTYASHLALCAAPQPPYPLYYGAAEPP